MSCGGVEASAQDVIVKRDGGTVISKVLEIDETSVKYKKASNVDGPTYTIKISEIQSINYENGERETFDNVSEGNAAKNANALQGYVEKPADARNAEILALHNREYGVTEKVAKKAKKESPAKVWAVILGVKQSSVMSNEDIEMTFRREVVTAMDGIGADVVYCISLKNKTDRPIYIDRGRCFRIGSDGNSLCYFEDSEQTTISVGGGSGSSVNLGGVAGALGVGGAVGQLANGVSVGGGSSHSVSTTYQKQRFIAIPPHGSRNLTEEKRVQTQKGNLIKDDKYQLVENAETFESVSENGLKRGFANIGQTIMMEEEEIPWNMEYIISYSTDENFLTYSSLKAKMYIHEIIGMPLSFACGETITANIKNEYNRDFKDKDHIEGLNANTITVFCRPQKED